MPDPTLWPISHLATQDPGEGIPCLDHFGAGVYQVLLPAELPSQATLPSGPAIQAALARLVGLIRVLYAPGMGWPSERPQTPENLLPYVSEEAEELFEQLQQAAALDQRHSHWSIHGPILNPQLSPQLSRDRPAPVTDHRFLTDLVSACLWGVTASSYEAMCLLEGVAATVELDIDDISEPWQGIRLLPCLCLDSPDMTWTLDIVTQATIAPTTGLPATTQIAPVIDDLDHQPQTVQHWVDRLWQALEQHQPALGTLRQGWEVALLLPHQTWCQGRLTLDLKLVGLPAPESAVISLPVSAPLLPGAAGKAADPPALNSSLQFTEADWIASFNNQVLSALPLPVSSLESEIAPLLSLVATAHERMVQTQTPGLFSRSLGSMPVSWQSLWPRWRWWVLQADTPLITLMGGVSATCLRPHHPWTKGILQARLSLKLQQGPTSWHLDLGTGEWYTPGSELPPGTLLTVAEGGPLATQVWPWERLKAQLIQVLCQDSPPLRLLWEGTKVTLDPGTLDPGADALALGSTINSATIGLQLEITFQPQAV